MEVRILGPLEVVDDAGREVPLKGARLRALLTLLAVHAGQVVEAGRIAELLWADDQPGDAANALQNQVSRLRRALAAGGEGVLIETVGPGYALRGAEGAVDARRFEADVRRGRQLLAEGDPVGAAAAFDTALARWRGEALAELGEDERGRAERARLDELRRGAEEDRAEAGLAAGRHTDLVGELERLVAAEPLRERRWAQLLLALYRSGRQADALRAYQDARSRLAEELGIEPGAELRRLEAAVLAQDPSLDGPVPAGPVAPAGGGPGRLRALRAPGRVPRPLTRCVGREAERTEVARLVAGHRLVTVVGPGGAGKTRLAVEVALEEGMSCTDGAVLVELAPVEVPAAVPGVATRALGLDDAGLAGHDDGGSGAYALLEQALTDRDLLLVLDNCEHVVDEAARLAVEVLGRCPGVRVLATSRQALGVPGEATFLVPPLAAADGVALFQERAGAAVPGLALDDADRRAAAEVCDRLDGMPLAIELAASRVRVFTVPQLAARLDDRFRVLTGGARTALPRQQTLRAVVEWSHELLDEDERRAFRLLSVFAGGCTLEAAEAVCGEDVAEVVDRLVDKSLVGVQRTGAGVRFTMLQTLTDYGREQLALAGEEDAARRRHAHWLLAQAVAAEGASELGGHTGGFAGLTAERDNLRNALAWAQDADPGLALELAAHLGWFWFFSDALADGWRVFRSGLAVSSVVEVAPAVRARALGWASFLALFAGVPEEGADLARRALALAEGLDDPLARGMTRLLCVALFVELRRDDEGEALLAVARRDIAPGGNAFGLAYLDVLEGVVANHRGDLPTAVARIQAAVARFVAIGEQGGTISALLRLAESAELVDPPVAEAAAEDALHRLETFPGNMLRCLVLARLASVRMALGRPADALPLADEAVDLSRRQTWDVATGLAHEARGRARLALGLDGAAADIEEARTRFAGSGMTVLAERVQPG